MLEGGEILTLPIDAEILSSAYQGFNGLYNIQWQRAIDLANNSKGQCIGGSITEE